MNIERIYKTRECQRRAAEKYRKEKVYRVCLTFTPNDNDLVEWLKSQPETVGKAIKKILYKNYEKVCNSVDK